MLDVLPIPGNEGVLRLLPRLAELLAGNGSPIIPVPKESGAEQIGLIAPFFASGAALPPDVAVIIGTSGTTGKPKGAQLTAAALLAGAAATRERLGGPGSWLLALPAHHIAGLQVLVRSVADGTEPVALDVGHGFCPADLAAAIDRMPPGRRYTSLIPTQLVKLLTDPAATRAAAELDAILLGGGAAPPAVVQRALDAGLPVVRTYGMSETAGGCIYDGLPLEGVTIRIDPTPEGDAAQNSGNGDSGSGDHGRAGGSCAASGSDGGGAGAGGSRRASEGAATPGSSTGTGRIHLAGPMLASGYRNAPDHPAFAEPGWFRTDDIGILDNGVLRVLGRADDAIGTGGLTVMPRVVEEAIGRIDGIAESVVVGVPDARLGQQIAAMVALLPGRNGISPEAITRTVADTLGRYSAPRRVLIVEQLPRLSSGKPDRQAIAAAFPPA